MNNAKLPIITYVRIGVSLFIFSFLANGWSMLSLRYLALVFALPLMLLIVASRVKSRRFARITEHIGNIQVGQLSMFLLAYGLAITLIKNNLLLPGLILVLGAYIVFYWWVGRLLGREVLRPLCNKLNIFIPSTKLPKDI
jgi:hypothetical protein